MIIYHYHLVEFPTILHRTTVVSSVVAMAIFPNPIVIAAGVSSAGLAPYAWYQQTKLTDIKST